MMASGTSSPIDASQMDPPTAVTIAKPRAIAIVLKNQISLSNAIEVSNRKPSAETSSSSSACSAEPLAAGGTAGGVTTPSAAGGTAGGVTTPSAAGGGSVVVTSRSVGRNRDLPNRAGPILDVQLVTSTHHSVEARGHIQRRTHDRGRFPDMQCLHEFCRVLEIAIRQRHGDWATHGGGAFLFFPLQNLAGMGEVLCGNLFSLIIL